MPAQGKKFRTAVAKIDKAVHVEVVAILDRIIAGGNSIRRP